MSHHRIITSPVIEDVLVLGLGPVPPAPAINADAPAPEPAVEVVEEAAAPVVDVEALQRDAREAGYQAGLQAGRDAGLKAGIEQGRQEAEARMAEALAAFQQAAAQLEAERRSLMADLEPEAVTLAFAIARRAFEHDAVVPRAVLEGLVRSALAEATGMEQLTLSMNPADVQAAGHARVEELLRPSACALARDESVPRGACVLDSNFGRVEVDFDSRWEAIAACLHEEMARAG